LSSRVGSWVPWAAVTLLLALPVGCGGDDDGNDNNSEQRSKPVAGTFVGEVQGGDALVAVFAAPLAKGQERREVSTFVCDAKRCAFSSGSASGNDFAVRSGDGEAQTKVELSGKAASGTVQLPDGKSARYEAGEATATAGLYDLTVSARGKVSGASAAGVGLTGEVKLPPPGSGRLKLADRTRLKFEVTKNTAGDAASLRAGQLRLIVLPDGQVRGAGKTRGGAGSSNFFVRSSAKKS
jgi:hypothetical protein